MDRTVRRAIPVVVTDDPASTVGFYVDVVGLRTSMDEDGMVMLVSESEPTTQVIVAWESPTAPDAQITSAALSVEVGDVDAVHRDATERGLEIVYPLTDEPWGVRRFFVRDPAGRVVNVAAHTEPRR